jgi:hypothetical protein
MRFRRWIGSTISVVAASVIALVAIGLQSPSTAFAATRSASHAVLVASRTTTFPWKGHDPSCEVRVPIPLFVRYARFTTCPPKRVLVLGDSVAITMGIQMNIDQEDWGAIVDVVATDGCGFVTGYDVNYLGRFIPMNRSCNNDAAVWTSDVRSFRPQAIVVEMGWWDSFPHMINGKVSLLSDPRYDSLVERQILGLTHSLRIVSAAPIYFLSVPWMQPSALPNGRPEPAASRASHNEINRLIRSAALSSTTTHFVNISPYITPAGHFQADVEGRICRASDGVHLYYGAGLHYVQTECGKALQRGVLSMIRQDLVKT